MKVSVLMPAYNPDEDLFIKALQSISNQSIQVDEIVIIDDGSRKPVNSLDLSAVSGTKVNIFINNRNIGIAKSLSRGASLCTGDIIFRLDCDDFWSHNHVESVLDTFNAETNVVLVSSRCIYVRNNNEDIGSVALESRRELFLHDMFYDNPLVHSGVAFLKNTYEKTI